MDAFDCTPLPRDLVGKQSGHPKEGSTVLNDCSIKCTIVEKSMSWGPEKQAYIRRQSFPSDIQRAGIFQDCSKSKNSNNYSKIKRLGIYIEQGETNYCKISGPYCDSTGDI